MSIENEVDDLIHQICIPSLGDLQSLFERNLNYIDVNQVKNLMY